MTALPIRARSAKLATPIAPPTTTANANFAPTTIKEAPARSSAHAAIAMVTTGIVRSGVSSAVSLTSLMLLTLELLQPFFHALRSVVDRFEGGEDSETRADAGRVPFAAEVLGIEPVADPVPDG